MTLAEFLLARFDEDERAAAAATPGPWRFDESDDEHSILAAAPHPESVHTNPFGVDMSTCWVAATSYDNQSGSLYNSTSDGLHIARHDPARVLAEVEAKRQIIELHRPAHWSAERCHQCGADDLGEDWWPCDTLKLLALPYADHPDFREEWRP